jgi:hypothetical protein
VDDNWVEDHWVEDNLGKLGRWLLGGGPIENSRLMRE